MKNSCSGKKRHKLAEEEVKLDWKCLPSCFEKSQLTGVRKIEANIKKLMEMNIRYDTKEIISRIQSISIKRVDNNLEGAVEHGE